MSNELLPCPFCGGKAETDASSVSEFYGHEHQDYTIKCTKCGADMTVYTHSNKDGTPSRGYEFGCSCCNDIPAAAKAKWNTRPQQSTTAGYVMVPVEPTPDMLLAGKRTIKGAADCTEGEQAEYAYKQMIAAAPKAEQPAHDVASVPDGLPLVIAGALFDFGGYLTTREKVIEVGATANASPMVDLIKEFADMRGLSLTDAAVLSWSELLPLAAAPQPAADCGLEVVMPPCPYCPELREEMLTDYEKGELQGRCDMWEEVKRLNGGKPNE